jgi:hypothetical protein
MRPVFLARLDAAALEDDGVAREERERSQAVSGFQRPKVLSGRACAA